MSRLPQVSGREIVAALKRTGWQVSRQRGSHVAMTKSGSIVSLSVPQHDPVRRGTLHDILSKAELTADEFIELL